MNLTINDTTEMLIGEILQVQEEPSFVLVTIQLLNKATGQPEQPAAFKTIPLNLFGMNDGGNSYISRALSAMKGFVSLNEDGTFDPQELVGEKVLVFLHSEYANNGRVYVNPVDMLPLKEIQFDWA